MYETYQFLSRIYGTPPIAFDYKGTKLTPLEFKNQYVKTDLNEYITVTTFGKENFYNSYSYIPNVYLNNTENIVYLSSDKVKKAIIKQLQGNISVWFSAEETTTLDYDINILDNKLYNFNSLLNIKEIAKNTQLSLDKINYDHAMCITGALVENNKIKQWKVENSFGKHGMFKGKLIMTDSFFDNCVLTTIINKKYLDR